MENTNGTENVVRVSKDEARLLGWLQDACAKSKQAPTNQLLTGIAVKEDYCVAVDGFRMHAIPTLEALRPFVGKVVQLDVPSKGGLAEVTVIGNVDKYPRIDQIIPQHKPAVSFYISPRLLAAALKGIEEDGLGATICVNSHRNAAPIEVMGHDPSGCQPVYAMIMPRVETRNNARGNRGWRPEYPTADRPANLKLLLPADATPENEDCAYAMLMDVDAQLLGKLNNMLRQATQHPEMGQTIEHTDLTSYNLSWYNCKELRNMAEVVCGIIPATELPEVPTLVPDVVTTCYVSKYGVEFVGSDETAEQHLLAKGITPWRLRELIAIVKGQ